MARLRKFSGRGVLAEVLRPPTPSGGCGQPDIVSAVTVTGPSNRLEILSSRQRGAHVSLHFFLWQFSTPRDALAPERHLVSEAAVPKLSRFQSAPIRNVRPFGRAEFQRHWQRSSSCCTLCTVSFSLSLIAAEGAKTELPQ